MKKLKSNFFFFKENWKLILLIFLLLLILSSKICWISILILVILFINGIFIRAAKLIQSCLVSIKILKGLRILILFIFSGYLIKFFIISGYKIPSKSMENSLYPNDFIIVNKLDYGPKLPIFFKNFIPKNRLPGLRSIKRGDIIVFENSFSTLVKRCVGQPGDTLKIVNSKLFINKNESKKYNSIKHHYTIELVDKKKFYTNLKELKIEMSMFIPLKAENMLIGLLSEDEIRKLEKLPVIVSVEKRLSKKERELFLDNNYLSWTYDNMSDFVIPRQGMTIELNQYTFNLYKKTLLENEIGSFEKINDTYYINKVKVKEYQFKKDYFFALGDNRNNSIDSRSYGFIPEESIIGSVNLILFSSNINRVLKKIN